MRLRHIEIFHAIYTSGSITSAAEMLCVSQPSVSKVLAHAEMQLGFLLFERSKGKLTPTSEADILFSEVDCIYRQLGSIKRMADNIKRNESGLIDIAISPALGFDVIPTAIATFHKIHPNVQFRIKTLHNGSAQQALLEHECDLAILFNSPKMSGVQEIQLGENEMAVMYPKKRFPDEPSEFTIEDLAQQELIGIWESGPLGELIWNKITQRGLEAKGSTQVDTYYIAASLVAKGVGCCAIDGITANANQTQDVGLASFKPPIKFHIKGLHLGAKPLPRICHDFLSVFKKTLAPDAQ